MRRDFVEYLPYIIVPLLIVSGAVIYNRGGFAERNSNIIDVAIATPIPTPISLSTPTTEPVLQVVESTQKPSINKIFGEDDD